MTREDVFAYAIKGIQHDMAVNDRIIKNLQDNIIREKMFQITGNDVRNAETLDWYQQQNRRLADKIKGLKWALNSLPEPILLEEVTEDEEPEDDVNDQ